MAKAGDIEKVQVTEGLTCTMTCLDTGLRRIHYSNSTTDRQFNIVMEFQSPESMTALGDTKADGVSYSISLFPGESKEMLTGKWKATRRKLQAKTPDQSWLDAQSKKLNQGVEQEVAAVEALVKKNGVDATSAIAIAKVCVENKVAFVDLTFPPGQQSLARKGEDQPLKPYPWMRPGLYCGDKKPCLYVGAIEPEDIDQGMLGDCYFMCALACLSEFPDLVKAAYRLPQYPELGMYQVRLCKDGWWNSVIVDDFLPIEPAKNLPAFAKNREEPDELWVSVLEKAYAKLNNSYSAIKAGDPAFAVADMVGGPYEKFHNRPEWENDKAAMFEFLMQCDEDDHLMALGTPGVDATNYAGGATGGGSTGGGSSLAEDYQKVGLCTGHAFSLIRVKKSQGHKLCMIRNPWGNDMEWNGAWSDDSPLWTDKIKEEVGFYAADDGTFWMCWDDVVKWFVTGSITYVLQPKGWSELRVNSSMQQGIPSVILEITPTAKDVEIWLGAHQRDTRGRKAGDVDAKYIGLLGYILTRDPKTGRSVKYLKPTKEAFQTARDWFLNGKLEKGGTYYALIQGFQDWDKVVNLSLYTNSDEGLQVRFLRYKSGSATKHNPATKFCVDDVELSPTDVQYQVVTTRHEVVIWAKGTACNWDEKPTAEQVAEIATRKSREKRHFSTTDTVGKGAGAAAAATAKAAAAAAPPSTTTKKAVSKPEAPAPPAPAPASTTTTSAAQVTAPPPPTGASTAKPVGEQLGAEDHTEVPRAQVSNSSFDSMPSRLRANSKNANEVRLEGWAEKYSTGRRTKGLKAMLPNAHNWKRRYFRLYGDGRLAYFESPSTGKGATGPVDTILLRPSTCSLFRTPHEGNHPKAMDKPHSLVIAIHEGSEPQDNFSLLLAFEGADAQKDWGQALTEFATSKKSAGQKQ